MKPHELNKVIATHCGWKEVAPPPNGIYQQVAFLTGDNNWWLNRKTHEVTPPCYLPKYSQDLNAMHEAEKTLTSHEFWNYVETLRLIVKEDCEVYIASATVASAYQRARAFVQILNNTASKSEYGIDEPTPVDGE